MWYFFCQDLLGIHIQYHSYNNWNYSIGGVLEVQGGTLGVCIGDT